MPTTQRIAFTALFIAMGLLLPILFHMIGSGPVFLPMHIPILLAGFLVGPGVGLTAGLITPGLSSILTGMPLLPQAVGMTFELATFGFLAGLLYRQLNKPLLWSLIMSMLGGRIVYGLLGALVLPLFGMDRIPMWAPLTVGVATGWPGILIQIVVVPAIVSIAERLPVFAIRSRGNWQ